MEIFDAHTNLIYPGEQLPETSLCPWRTFDERLAVLREAGITHALACRNQSVAGMSAAELADWNRRIVAVCQASDDLLIPAAIVQPALGKEACDLLRYCREELRMRFVGELFDRWLGFEWGTPAYDRFLQCAIELHMIPLIHCDNDVATDIGQQYPEGKFLLPHFNGRWDPQQRVKTLKPFPNLYLVTSGCWIASAGLIKASVDALGAERVVFGSDFGGVDPVIAVQCVERAGLDTEQKQLVLAENFKALLAYADRD